MRRATPNIMVVDPLTGSAIGGATVEIRERGTNALATLYTTEAGSTEASNPQLTDTWGRTAGWLDRGEYRADISGTGIASYSVFFEAAPAGDGAIDTDWIADGAVTPAKAAFTAQTSQLTSPTTVSSAPGTTNFSFTGPPVVQPGEQHLVSVLLDLLVTGGTNTGEGRMFLTCNGADLGTNHSVRLNFITAAVATKSYRVPVTMTSIVTIPAGPADQSLGLSVETLTGTLSAQAQNGSSRISSLRVG